MRVILYISSLINCPPPLSGSEVTLMHNKSGRFESRFVSVGILPSPSIMLKGMEGSALGVWVAHGEGGTLKNYLMTIISMVIFL